MMHAISKAYGRLLEAMMVAACLLLLAMTILIGADVISRNLGLGGIFWSNEISEDILGEVRGRDEQDLAHVQTPAAEAFYASVMRDQNARRVCGLGCIYAALKTAEGRIEQARLLSYSYAPDPAGGIVSFATMAVTGPPYSASASRSAGLAGFSA